MMTSSTVSAHLSTTKAYSALFFWFLSDEALLLPLLSPSCICSSSGLMPWFASIMSMFCLTVLPSMAFMLS